MGIDNIFLSLIPLIIAVVIGFMIGWLIGFGVAFLGVMTTLFIMGVLNHSCILSVSAIPFFILFLLCAFESVRRIVSESNFEKRIAQYITEGKELQRTSYEASDEYERVANDWVNKVASDIQKHRGQPEANLFLVEWDTKQSVSEDSIRNMLSSRYGWLEWFQQRL